MTEGTVNLGMLPRVSFDHKVFDLTNIIILTPRKMFQGLPITLALVKGVNKNLSNINLPENLSNEI